MERKNRKESEEKKNLLLICHLEGRQIVVPIDYFS